MLLMHLTGMFKACERGPVSTLLLCMLRLLLSDVFKGAGEWLLAVQVGLSWGQRVACVSCRPGKQPVHFSILTHPHFTAHSRSTSPTH